MGDVMRLTAASVGLVAPLITTHLKCQTDAPNTVAANAYLFGLTPDLPLYLYCSILALCKVNFN